MEVPVNYLAVFAAAVASMALGALWYGPLFGKQWKEVMGFSDHDMKNMTLTAPQAMGIGFVVALVTAYVFSHVFVFSSTYMQVSGYMAGLSTAFWLWLGFVATTQIGAVLWDGKPWKLFFITASYSLVSLAVMGVIIASWPAVA